jgi:[protein-PII] uridylyltransferase
VDVFYLQEASAGALADRRAAEAAHAVRAALSREGPVGSSRYAAE